MRKFIRLIFLLPLAIILILLSVANRQPVRFSLDPLNSETPALAFELPFFVFLFIALSTGILIGSLVTWFSQGKYRKKLRSKSREASVLRREHEEAQPEQAHEIAPGLPAITSSGKAA